MAGGFVKRAFSGFAPFALTSTLCKSNISISNYIVYSLHVMTRILEPCVSIIGIIYLMNFITSITKWQSFCLHNNYMFIKGTSGRYSIIYLVLRV